LGSQSASLRHPAEHFLPPSGDYAVPRDQTGPDGWSEARGRLRAGTSLSALRQLVLSSTNRQLKGKINKNIILNIHNMLLQVT
jgi:hypothetical protein